MSTSLRHLFVMACLLTVVTGLHTAQPTAASDLSDCLDLGFSVEQSFLTQGPVPPNGNPIISEGDLLAPHGAICARNTELLAIFSITEDLGLDAVAVVGSTPVIAAFSTEIDDPGGRFTAGDLLSTNGAIVAHADDVTAHNSESRSIDRVDDDRRASSDLAATAECALIKLAVQTRFRLTGNQRQGAACCASGARSLALRLPCRMVSRSYIVNRLVVEGVR